MERVVPNTCDHDINTAENTTINSNDVNRYRRGVPIFRYFTTNLSASTHVSFSPASSLPVPWLLFQPLVRLRFQESYLLRFHAAIAPLTSLCAVSLLEETVYPVVRLPPRCSSRPFPVSLLVVPFLPARVTAVTSTSNLRTRPNCFPIRHLLNIRATPNTARIRFSLPSLFYKFSCFLPSFSHFALV